MRETNHSVERHADRKTIQQAAMFIVQSVEQDRATKH